MSFTHTIRSTWTDGVVTLGSPVSLSNEGQIASDVTIAGSATNTEVTAAFTLAQLKSIYILSDQDLTLKTNSSGSPQETITLKAGFPLIWMTGYGTVPFAGTITKFFFTNAGATAANVNIRALLDATP